MAPTADYYKTNPLVHRDRRLGEVAPPQWVRSFACEDLKPLIVCRGPIRKEAMDVFEEMGIRHYGILLSEKDSIAYANALAPELRQLIDTSRVHRVPDYTGATKEERVERMNQIVRIARDNGYDSVFAGYGFMAEDEEFVATLERAGLKFIGPNSVTQARAGKKDEAKRTALEVGVSVTPGVNDVAARTLLSKHKTRKALLALVEAEDLACDPKVLKSDKLSARGARRSRPHGVLREGDRPLHDRRARLAGAARGHGAVQEAPRHPRSPEGDRRRRRQGPANPRRRAPHRQGGRREAHRGGRRRGADARARGAERGQGDRRRRQQERPHRAQHRADPPQRDPAPRQRPVVRLARRARLLAADARAEAARDLRDAGGPHRRDREGGAGGQEGRAPRARDRPRDPEADGGRRGALRRGGRARLRLDLRVHRRPRPLLLHGGQHPHPGRAPGHRALLLA